MAVFPPPPPPALVPAPARRGREAIVWAAVTVGLAFIAFAVASAVARDRASTASTTPTSTPATESPSASASPTPPFEIINTPVRHVGLPAGWVRIEASDGCFSMVGPGDATLRPSGQGFWELLVPGAYPTFTIFIYEGPDPAEPTAYTRGRLRAWASEFGKMDEMHAIRLGSAVGWRARMLNDRGSRGAAQVVIHDGLEFSMSYYRIGNPLGKRGRRLGLAVFNSLRMPASDVIVPP